MHHPYWVAAWAWKASPAFYFLDCEGSLCLLLQVAVKQFEPSPPEFTLQLTIQTQPFSSLATSVQSFLFGLVLTMSAHEEKEEQENKQVSLAEDSDDSDAPVPCP